jgi:hypothetical protein
MKKFKVINAKQGPFRKTSTGFPDFICIKQVKVNKLHRSYKTERTTSGNLYYVEFVECKTNGYLSKEEKEKAKWYLENNFCSKFLIASKEKRGIKYEEYKSSK